ncbi:MAG: hypothetical protein ACFFD4_05310 [Candidatus Odinarchaeota archaeon]
MALQITSFAGIIVSALLSALIIGLTQSFNSKGPVMVTLVGSTVLAVNLTGLRIGNGIQNPVNPISTRFGWFTFIHSHHTAEQRTGGHEFRIGEKFFCTGCYGILSGTIIAITVFVVYLLLGMSDQFAFLAIIIAPICFIPIILRYTVMNEMKTKMRLLSNSLLPVGCSLYLVTMDHIFQSWEINMCIVLFTLTVGFTRGLVAYNSKNERKK